MLSFSHFPVFLAPLTVSRALTPRFISTTSSLHGKGRTYESQPVPGSQDHVDPLAWAQRLFDLHEIRQSYKFSDKPSPIFMICRLKPIKGTPFFEKALLEKFGIGPKTKVHHIPQHISLDA